jgi:hypothetical protein
MAPANNTLSIVIDVDDREAVQKLKGVDRALDDVRGTTTKAGESMSDFEQEVRKAIDADVQLITGTQQLATVTTQTTGTMATLRAGLNQMADAAGITYKNLGLLSSATLVASAAMAGWAIGRTVAEFFGLDKAIANTTARLIGWGNVAAQETGAKQDVINLAVKRGANAMITYASALEFNAKWFVEWQAKAKAMDDVAARIHAPQELADQMAKWNSEIDKVRSAGSLPALIAGINSHVISVKELSASYRISEGAINLFKQRLADEAKAHTTAKNETTKHKTELAQLTAEVRKVESGLFGLPAQLHTLGRAFDETKIDDFTNEVAKVEQNTRIAAFGFQGMVDSLKHVGTAAGHTQDELDHFAKFDFVGPIQRATKGPNGLEDLTRHFVELGQIAGGSLDGFTRGVGLFIANMQQMSQSTDGLKGDFKDLKKDWDDLSKSQKEAAIVMAGLSIAAAATDPKSKTGQTLSYASKGAQIGSIAGPYGTLIGAGVGAIVGALKVSQNEKEARTAFAAFQQQFGTLNQTITAVGKAYADMGLSGVRAEHDLRVALDATHHSAKDVEAALATINAVLNEQKQDAADLDAAIQKYGFSLEELGPKMQKQRLDEQATTILNDWRLLVASGIDLTTVNEHMASTMTDYLHQARLTGQEVPASMKPILQTMLDQGLLTDEAGTKITDLKDLGVAFSETMTQGFERVVQKLSELIDKLGLVPNALNAIPDHTVHIDYEYAPYNPPDYGSRGGLVTAAGIQHLAGGGRVLPFPGQPRGTDNIPIWASEGERLLSVRQNRAYEAGGGGDAKVLAELKAMRADTAAMRAEAARREATADRRFARAMRDETQKVARR